MQPRLFVLCALAALAAPIDAEAAVVRSLRAFPSAVSTRIVVSIDGEFRYRTHRSDDAKSVLVDIQGATLGEDTPRILPVSDRRVDGVVVLGDAAARIVRVSVDVAGRVAPRLEARIEASRLILEFFDAAAAAPAAPPRAVERDTEDADVRSDSADPPVANPRRAPNVALRAARGPGPGTRAATAVSRSGTRQGAALPAARAVAASPAARRSVVQKAVVVLDPGHGGKDPGARAWTGEVEKDIVLDLADRVARRLRSRGDIEVVMTRSDDRFVPLADRRDASRRWEADAFVSIHANASHSAAARGFETYYHSRTTAGSAMAQSNDRGIRRLARAENGGMALRDRRGSTAGVLPASVSPETVPVLDRRAESAQLAKLVQGELVRQLGMRYEAVRDLGAREGPFFVIGHNAAPSVLVEAAFLTHREEGLRMRSEVYREQIADGVARGIVAFLEQQRHGSTL